MTTKRRRYRYLGTRFPYFRYKVFPLAYEQFKPKDSLMLYVGSHTGFVANKDEVEELEE